MTSPNFRFATKESATHAIVATHNTEINGQTVKCSWGKEAGDPNNQQQQQVSYYFLSLYCTGGSENLSLLVILPVSDF